MRKYCALNPNYSSFVSEEKFKILRLDFSKSTRWSYKFNQTLRFTRHFISVLLTRIQSRKTILPAGQYQVFLSWESNSCSSSCIHSRTVLSGPPSDGSGARTQIHTGGCVTLPGLESQRPQELVSLNTTNSLWFLCVCGPWESNGQKDLIEITSLAEILTLYL